MFLGLHIDFVREWLESCVNFRCLVNTKIRQTASTLEPTHRPSIPEKTTEILKTNQYSSILRLPEILRSRALFLVAYIHGLWRYDT